MVDAADPLGPAEADHHPPLTGKRAIIVSTYIVLRRERTVPDSDDWHVLNHGIEAPDADTAIRKEAGEGDDPSGVYVAIPARSWKPITVTAETQVVIRLTNNDTTEPTTEAEEEAPA
jgi:hypothetical protein